MASSCEDSDDDFIVLGNPLPELIEGEPKKPNHIQDQTARDKQGRRRFHGAFTGGFSAGYFNSVGTKEGFQPSTFISSRSKKNEEIQEARPENFMDDEDLEEHGIAPRKFATVSNFTSEERKRKHQDEVRQITAKSTVDFGSTLEDLIVPERLPIGIKLLRKMGWRVGQGLGPRVKKKKKRKKAPVKGVKSYGCALPPSDNDSDSDDYVPDDLSEVTFAPQDVCPISLEPKDNVHGLGYQGLNPSLALPGSHINLFDNAPLKSRSGKGIRSQAFGVGAFEDEDDDIYTVEDMSQYNIAMDSGKPTDSNFGWTAPREHGKQNVPVSYVGKLLEGFCLSSKQLKAQKKFPPPDLPRHFKSQHWFRKTRMTSHIAEHGDEGKMLKSGSMSSQLTAVDRGLMLGETPVMGSVFDLIQNKDMNRIEATKEAIAIGRSLTGSKDHTLTHNSPQTIGSQPNTEPDIRTDPSPPSTSSFLSKFKPAEAVPLGSSSSSCHTPKTPLFQGGVNFQPFRTNPVKQARYDNYLALIKQGVKDPYLSVTASNMTEWEKSREKEEFAKASKVFRPLSALMSTRFVQGAMIDDEGSAPSIEAENEKCDQGKAADMKMFGQLTREEVEWHPDKLLCRRFNVPHPYPGSDIVGLTTVKRDKYSIFNFLSMGDYQPSETQEPSVAAKNIDETKGSGSGTGFLKKKPTLASVFKVLDDPDFNKPTALPMAKHAGDENRPKSDCLPAEDKNEEADSPDMDLFRAIFKNSDSEISDSSNNEENDDNNDSDVQDKETEMDEENVESTLLQVSYKKLQTPQKPESDQAPGDNDLSQRMHNNLMSSAQDHSSSMNPFNSVQRDPGLKSRLGKSRWEGKSVFSVLDDIEADEKDMTTHASRLSPTPTGSAEHDDSYYGPQLPPGLSCTPAGSVKASVPPVVQRENERREYFFKDEKIKKHKHKKEKKKKSKHKKDKKYKKHKNKKKSSKSSKSKQESSGSEADTESSSDLSDGELIERIKTARKDGLKLDLHKKKL